MTSRRGEGELLLLVMVPVLVVSENNDTIFGAVGVVFAVASYVEATHGWDRAWCT